MAKQGGMYDETPSIKHDADGKTSVKKAEKKKPSTAGKDEKNGKDEGFPMHVRHAMERRDMNSRHETEHGVVDASKAGDKKEMHGRHEAEMKAMLTKHEKEAGATGGSTVDQPIEKVEKGAKA